MHVFEGSGVEGKYIIELNAHMEAYVLYTYFYIQEGRGRQKWK
jgi:hypothetical protein